MSIRMRGLPAFSQAAALVLALALPAKAATLTYKPFDGGRLITLEGQIELHDYEDFLRLPATLGQTIVSLSSPGGSLDAGLNIGSYIHRHGYTTFVPKDHQCFSACALIWIGGATRGISYQSFLGFHAVSDAGTLQISSSGNAMVGAYLNQLGMSQKTIIWLTDADPDEIAYLTPSKASELGIKTVTLPRDLEAGRWIGSAVSSTAPKSTCNPIDLLNAARPWADPC